MKPSKVLFSLLILALTALICGCTSKTAQDSTIPWSRPAAWEGQIPGMGTPGEGSPGAPH